MGFRYYDRGGYENVAARLEDVPVTATITLWHNSSQCKFELDRNCLALMRKRLRMRETPDEKVVCCLIQGMLGALVEFEDDPTITDQELRAYRAGREFMERFIKGEGDAQQD